MHDDDLRQRLSTGPGRGKRAVGEHIALPGVGDDQAGHRRVGAQEVRLVPPVQHLERLDLRRREAFGEFRRRLRQRFEMVMDLGSGRGRKQSDEQGRQGRWTSKPIHLRSSTV